MTEKKLILYFHFLLLASTIMLADIFLLFWLRGHYDAILVFIVSLFTCGAGSLFILNSIVGTFRKIYKRASEGIFLYTAFTSIFVLLVSGTFIVVPGITSTVLGLLLYLKPIRMYISHVFVRKNTPFVTQAFSHLLASMHLPTPQHSPPSSDEQKTP